jgi:MOSC domain-containing protein YiiM
MQLKSVNIGQPRTQRNGKELETTGIYLVSTPGSIEISVLGIAQDFIGDQEHHGGVDQAIYVYGTTDYDWWSQELDRALAPGTFGENLTITDLESSRLSIGDRLRVGTAILEVTAPRFPCSTLATRMGDPGFGKKYRSAERPGLYCRVIVEGTLQAGQEVVTEPHVAETISVL